MHLPAWCPRVITWDLLQRKGLWAAGAGRLAWNPPCASLPVKTLPYLVPLILSGDHLLHEAYLDYLHYGVLF